MTSICKHKEVNEARLFETSNQDFLFFVIKYLSDDPYNWQNEWDYEGMYKAEAQCVCGKEGLTKVFVVRNTVTNKVLSPIGSVCIDHFSNNVLNSIKNTLNENLLAVILSENKYNESKLAMSSKYLSKDEVKLLNDAGIIDDEETKICLKALNKKSADTETFLDATDIFIDKIIPALKKSLITALNNTRANANDVYFDRETREYFEELYRFSKQNRFNISEIEDYFGGILPGSRNAVEHSEREDVSESLTKTKKRIYNEMIYLDSFYKNFYEARIIKKGDNKFLVLENHLVNDDTFGGVNYGTLPSEVNVFVIDPDINVVDDVLDEEDFDNNFEELPEPDFSLTVCSEEDLKNFFDNI